MSGDFLDLDVLRVPQVEASEGVVDGGCGREKSVGWVDGEFLRGPIPLSWLSRVCCLPGQKVLAVALAIWFLRGLRNRTEDLSLTDATVARFGVQNRSAKYRALEA